MAIRITETEVYLEGDWTYAAVAQQMDSLALSLEQIAAAKRDKFRIDCRRVQEADANGLQILHVWLECARMRGVEPILTHISGRLLKTMKNCNFGSIAAGGTPRRYRQSRCHDGVRS